MTTIAAPVIVASIGAVLFLVGMVRTTRMRSRVLRSIVADAEVVEHRLVPGSSKEYYRIVARFTDTAGNEQTYVSPWRVDIPDRFHPIGCMMRVMYDEAAPHDAQALSFFSSFGVGWFAIGIGLLMLWVAAGWAVADRILAELWPLG